MASPIFLSVFTIAVIIVPSSIGTLRKEKAVAISFPDADNLIENVIDNIRHAELLSPQENFDLKKMNLSTLKKLNTMKNRHEFAAFFGIVEPRTGGGINANGKNIENVGCAPVPTLVYIPPVDTSTVYYPSCVLLDRCGGCCYGSLLSCQPEEVEEVKVNVMKIATDTRAGLREREEAPQQETTTVVQELHKSCACKCKMQAKDCNPKIQDYNQDECDCVCKDKSNQSSCEMKNGSHYWDSKTCFCYCRKVLECSSGQNFEHSSCSCKTSLGSTFKRASFTDNNGRSAGKLQCLQLPWNLLTAIVTTVLLFSQ